MAKPTREQMAEFERYSAEHQGKPISEEALKGVVEDDVKEKERRAKARAGWSREYNRPPEKVQERKVAEEDTEP